MKFSIITCTYNSAAYLQKNIDSVKNQNFHDFEHIFIDGSSTDKTIEIIKKYHEEFPDKVKLFQFKPKGIANAMNEGIKKASGEYICHLHSDDSFFGDQTLQKLSDFIGKNKKPDWVYGKANFFDEKTGKSRIIPHRKIYHKIRFWLLLLTNYVPHQSVFLKKEVFEEFGLFREDFKNSMDYEMWLRLSKNNVNSKFFDQTVCNFSLRDDSQSSKEKFNNEHVIAYKRHLKNTLLIKFLTAVDRLNKKRSIL